ncbi:MAG: rhomboid family intramembrane serine protease [Acidithiobacillales bacterium]
MRPAYEIRYVGPPGWRRLGPVTRATLVLTVVGYLAGLIPELPVGLLTAVPERVWPGLELWRLVTYPLVNVGIISVLFGLLILWSFGSELEPEWGSGGYALFLVLAALSGGVLGVAASLLLQSPFGSGYGLAGPLTAVIVAWTLEGPSRPTNFFGVLPMTRKVFGVIAIVVVAFGELEQTHSIARLVFVLGGLPVSWWWARRRPPGGKISLRPPRFLRRRRFRVVGGDEDRVH